MSFTQPIIPAGGTIDDLDWRPILEPEPKDGGDWRVINGDTLAYQPHKAWTHSTEYTITVMALFTCGMRACTLRWSANREPSIVRVHPLRSRWRPSRCWRTPW